MSVLVIGASSFIGCYTVDELVTRGVAVVATGRNEAFARHYEAMGVPYVRVDITDEESFRILDGYEIEAAASLAALMPANVEGDNRVDDLDRYVATNVLGTLNILNYLRGIEAYRLVDVISRFDWRLYPEGTVLAEGDAPIFSYTDDHAAYVVSNMQKAQALEYFNERYGMRNVWLRIPSVYGVGPHGSYCKDGVYRKSGLQQFIDKAKDGEIIEVYGDPRTQKDCLYVKDMAQAISNALLSDTACGEYNVAYDRNFTVFEMAEAAADVFAGPHGRSEVVVRPEASNNGGFPRMSNDKVKRELDFQPQFDDFHDMMRDWKAEEKRGVYPGLFGSSRR